MCTCREEEHYPYDDPQDLAYRFQVKDNAPDLLRRALSRIPVDLVATGDYQAAERKFEVSRRMLEVCLELGFPALVLERSVLGRSPLVLRDLDMLKAIDERATAVVFFSIVSTPDSPHHDRVCQMERLAPWAARRFAAMEEIARAGILTGTRMIPVLPCLCGGDANLRYVVRWTADHGGQFVLASGLTLSDQQRGFFLGVLGERFPELVERYRSLYPPDSYGAAGRPWRDTDLRICELCEQYVISDRMPRPVIPRHKRTLNLRVVEALVKQLYYMELDGQVGRRVWAYRKAAWALEDTPQDLGLIYRQMGRKGLASLASIENVGPRLAHVVESLIQAWT